MASGIAQSIAEEFEKAFSGSTKTVTPKTPKAKKEELFSPVVLTTAVIPFSKVFGFVPPSGIDHDLASIYYDPIATWDTASIKRIPKKNPNYIWQTQQLEDLIIALLLGDKTWVTGPRGWGKSSLVEQVAAHLNWPFIRVNGKGDMDSSGVFGYIKVQANNGVPETVWIDGPVTTAVKTGAILLFDEPTVVPPEIAMGLQWLLEDQGKLMLTDMPGEIEDKLITPHPNFRFVCADNTRGRGDATGEYAGTGNWNTATIDRFGTTIELPFLDAKHQTSIISKAFPGISKILVEKMVELGTRIQSSYKNGTVSYSISPRVLLSWAKKAIMLRDSAKSFRMAFFEKLDSDVERGEVENLYFLVFNEKLCNKKS